MSVFNVTSPFWVPGLLVLFATVASRVDAQQINQAPVAFFVDENAKQVARFLNKGGNPNADYNGRAALHIAASGGHLKVMKLLIDHGADVNAKDRSRRSPLVEAAALLEPQAVKILLEAGAEPADSALEVASRNGRIEAAKLFVEAGVRPDAGMAGAASGGHSEILKLLLDKGANVDVRLSDGSTPLHLAARSGGLNTVRLLLGTGADPNATDNKGETPLHSAIVGHSDLESIRLLVQSGANLNVGNEEGVTPVRLAAMRRANVVYDWLLNVAWGKEPPVLLSDAQRDTTKSTNQLIASLSSRDRQTRLAAQRELVARGQKVMPDVLQAMKEATSRDPFYQLFMAMGPDAEAALPMLESQLGDKKLGPFTLFVIEAMKPGAVAELGDETKQKAMAALYDAIADPKTDVLAGFLADFLIRFGKPATPTILRLLRHPEPRYRNIMAGSLATLRYSDEQIQSELVKMSRNDPNLAVRTEAAEALGTVGDLGVHARAALLAIVNMPTWPHDSFEDRTATDRAARLLGKFGPSIIDDLIPLLHGHWWPRANQFSPPPQVLVVGQRYDVRRLPAHQFSPSPQAMAANIALQSIGARAVPRLVELLAHEDRFVATSASTALERIRPPAVPALSQAVSSRNDQVINCAANALGRLGRGAKAALPTLLEVAASEERSDLSRVAAASAALRIDASTSRESKAIQATIPLLIRLLEHGSFADQGRAAEILQGIGPPARDALPALRERLKVPPPDDSNAQVSARYGVRNAAKAAIAAIEADSDEE